MDTGGAADRDSSLSDEDGTACRGLGRRGDGARLPGLGLLLGGSSSSSSGASTPREAEPSPPSAASAPCRPGGAAVTAGGDGPGGAASEEASAVLVAAGDAAGKPSVKRKVRRQWAFDDEWEVGGFDKEVPNPALEFPFELDPFQKRAVRRVERSEHVLVCAHTSAGKTVIAEYAIAHALRQGMRTIYTSPIKALSNQKFREFSKRFEGVGTVGIVTGDVAVNPDAGVVIMTTEILRSMLYRGDKGLNSVKWVIFDEVHYVNDADRGVVWEEVIILLPAEVSMVMLSATVPNYEEFAGWVGRTKRRPVYTVHTSYRPTPLRHFLHFQGRTMPLLDAEGFHCEAFHKIKEIMSEKKKPPVRKVKHVTVKFESRPFGMTPLKAGAVATAVPPEEGAAASSSSAAAAAAAAEGGAPRVPTSSAYVVDKVNADDPSKPAWRLGVRPGWVLVAVNGADVRVMTLDAIQQAAKEAPLPAMLDFEVPPKDKDEKKQPEQPHQKQHTRESRERTETQRLQALLRELQAEELLPATVFVFSRRRVESLAAEMPNIDVCTGAEKSKVHIFLKDAFERLCEADKALPQVKFTIELAKRGIGIHHGGLLPLVKEAVEIMFSRGLVKVLLATETFAMGVNMPARSVIFTSWVKHDGARLRPLLPSEYTQMAGRAGRRGLDEVGNVYLLCGEDAPDQKQLTQIMTHKAERLNSRFRVTFAMILQLRRGGNGVKIEDVLGRSFLENGRAMRRPSVRRDLARRVEELDQIPLVQCIFGEPLMEEYAPWETEARAVGVQMHEQLYKPHVREKVFCPGRVLRVFKVGSFASSIAVLLGHGGGAGRSLLVAALLPGDLPGAEGSPSASSDCAGGSNDTEGGPPVQVQAGWIARTTSVTLEGVVQIFEQCLDVGLCRSALAAEANDNGASAAADGGAVGGLLALGRELLRLASEGGTQPLVLNKVSRQVDIEAHDTLQRQRRLQQLQETSRCHTCPLRAAHFEQSLMRSSVAAEIEDLDKELGAESLGLLPQLHAREKVLQALGCIGKDGLITLKGRAATEVLSGDEVTILEIVFHNVLDGSTPEYVAAAISAFVFPDKVDEEAEEVPLPKPLIRIRDAMLQHHKRIENLLREHGVDVDPEEPSRMCNVALMGIAYRWACGESLANIMPDTWLQEGTIVRSIVRAEELLRKLQDVAKLLGNMKLRQVFKEAAELIHRDIAFVPSLYIQ